MTVQQPQTPTEPTRILVIDPDDLGRMVAQRALSGGGYQVVEAASVAAAVEVLKEQQIDCILLDLEQPDGEGMEFISSLQAAAGASALSDGPPPPVVVLTEEHSQRTALELLNIGAEDCLQKSRIDREGIARAVAFAMERYRVRARLSEDNAALSRLAYRDPMTRLLNRRGMQAALARGNRDLPRFAILVDLDNFKTINDTFGHHVGDLVIQRTAEVLSRSTRPSDLVARVGGDEFLVVCEADELAQAAGIAERICTSLLSELSVVPGLAEAGHRSSASLGVTPLSPDVTEVQNVVSQSTSLLSRSKKDGKGRVTVADARSDPRREIQPIEMVASQLLRVGVAPVFSLSSGETIGYEYMLRMPKDATGSVGSLFRRAGATGNLDRIELHSLSVRLLAAVGQSEGAVYIPFLIDSLLIPEVEQRLASARGLLGDRRLVLQLWSTGPLTVSATMDERLAALRELGVEFGLSRIGFGGVSLQAVASIQPCLLRIDAAIEARNVLEDASLCGQLKVLAGVASALGATVHMPNATQPAVRERLIALGVTSTTGQMTELAASTEG